MRCSLAFALPAGGNRLDPGRRSPFAQCLPHPRAQMRPIRAALATKKWFPYRSSQEGGLTSGCLLMLRKKSQIIGH